MGWRRMALIGAALAALITSARASDCIDLKPNPRLEFTGVLRFAIFPGSPGFADVNKGDTPEPSYILDLDEPICLTGDDMADPKLKFRTVHLVPKEGAEGALRSLIGAKVDVSLSDPMAANTGHHHAPLVAWVETVEKAYSTTGEYGSSATVVRGFYEALAAGSGEAAAQFILPELRRGPFDPAALSAFYGGLIEPLRLIALDARGPDAYGVRYAFVSRAGRCDGRAEVKTAVRGGRAYIARIRALDGC